MTGRRQRDRLAKALGALAVVMGAVGIALLPTVARAAMVPSISVVPGSGSVGSEVTLNVSGGQCGDVVFEQGGGAHVGSAIYLFSSYPRGILPHGHALIPGFVGPAPSIPVTPGSYQFVMSCNSSAAAGFTTVTVPFVVTSSAMPPSRFVAMAPTPSGRGYWLAQSGGGVYSFGNAGYHGSLPGLGITPAAPIVGIAATRDGNGYWLVGADGGVFAFGDARFQGSLPSLRVDPATPVVGIATTADGAGYWLIGGDGGVFAFGSAPFCSVPLLTASATLPQGSVWGPTPDVGIASDPVSNGYDVVDAAGQGVAFPGAGAPCDMQNHSYRVITADNGPSSEITGVATSKAGTRLWLVTVDGDIWSPNVQTATGWTAPSPVYQGPGLWPVPATPIVSIAATPDGKGFWYMGTDGGVFTFGDAGFFGSAVH